MFKKLWIFLSAIVLLASFSGVAYAKTPMETEALSSNGDFGAKYTYIRSTSVNLTINTIGKATCSATLSAYSCVDRVRISAYLQYYDGAWYTEKHWIVEEDGTYAVLSKERYVASGYQYRLLVYYYAFSDDDSESTHAIDYYDFY